MAGEIENTITYESIDANKMLNKAGLLELSGQIKGYIQANTSGGASYTAGDGIDITNDVISSTVKNPRIITYQSSLSSYSNDDKTYLINFYNNQKPDPINYPCAFKDGDVIFKYYGYQSSHRQLFFIGYQCRGLASNDSSKTQIVPILIRVIFDSNGRLVAIYQNAGGTIGGFRGLNASCVYLSTAAYNPSGQENLLTDEMRYIKDNYATKAELPPIPADPSTDGTYVLQNTVSSGTATYSWGTPSGGGGGTTYTAGAGISIENGVISLNLASAEEEVF